MIKDADIGVANSNRDAGIKEIKEAAMNARFETDTKIEDDKTTELTNYKWSNMKKRSTAEDPQALGVHSEQEVVDPMILSKLCNAPAGNVQNLNFNFRHCSN